MLRLLTFLSGVLYLHGTPALAQQPLQLTDRDSLLLSRQRYSLFRPVPRARLRPMSTGRPDATESAYSVDAGHFQVETDVVRLGQQRFYGEASQQLAFNHANIKLGLTRQMDLQVVVESYTIQTEDAEQPVRRAGFGDVTLRLKRNLWGNDGGATALALMPFVKLPTGRSCGNRAWEGGLVAPFAWQLPRDWSFGSQLQASWNRDPEAQAHYLELAPTVTVGHDLYRTLGGFLEVAAAWDTRAPAWTATLNGGPIWRVTDNVQLDLGVNLALTQATETSYFLGLSFRR
ncbi:transporter [Hymenobacter lutimineralis]|uniref:Transporter n=1 Tax=Hymenobacter lutimineralis TaxID=2606448 RepID=A0A5D6UWL7_9BACT|nr:transporter [Hymenobacter lutimineralis]TYZ07288.1 transporter [Hymenobacter lutimineralis]